MKLSFKDTLLTICSKVEIISANDEHEVFLLTDVKEAKLASEILASYGVEIKFYPEANNTARLYVARVDESPATRQSVDKVVAYAHALKSIQQGLGSLQSQNIVDISDFTLTFSNTPEGKRIAIALNSAATPLATKPEQRPLATEAPRPMPAKAAPVRRHRYLRKSFPKNQSEDPSLETSYPVSTSKSKNKNYFSIKTYGHEIIGMLVLSAIILVFAVGFMGILCPDMATTKNAAWYCNIQSSVETIDNRHSNLSDVIDENRHSTIHDFLKNR